MQTFRKELLADLDRVRRLLNMSDEETAKQLLRDQTKLMNCIYGIPATEPLDFGLDAKSVIKSIMHNKVDRIAIKPFFFFSKTDADVASDIEVFQSFMASEDFGLREVYDFLLKKGRLRLFNKPAGYLGATLHLQSIGETYVEVLRTGNIGQHITKVHELGHAKQFLESGNKHMSAFVETFSSYLELKFLDHMRLFSRVREQYNMKYDKVMTAISIFDTLYDTVDDNCLSSREFMYRYQLFMSDLLAFYFYIMEKKNPLEARRQIDAFNRNFGNISDRELLEAMGLSFEDLTTHYYVMPGIMGELNKEREEIKQKILT